MRRILTRLAAVLLAAVVVLYGAAVGYLYVFQRDFVFQPSGSLASPADEGLAGVEVIVLRAEDGTALAGWYAPAGPGRPTVLNFHGNAGNLADRAARFSQILGSGFGLLAMSYRGFPGSEGSPSEAAFFADALTIYDWLAERTPDIVLHGESLGTGVATHVAAERDAEALILEAPYTATVDIAAAAYPWIPVTYLMHDQFRSREHIRDVEEPVLIVHGTADTLIPVDHGRRLYEAAGDPKQIAIVEGGRHNDLWDRGLGPLAVDFLRRNGAAGQADAEVRRIPSVAGR